MSVENVCCLSLVYELIKRNYGFPSPLKRSPLSSPILLPFHTPHTCTSNHTKTLTDVSTLPFSLDQSLTHSTHSPLFLLLSLPYISLFPPFCSAGIQIQFQQVGESQTVRQCQLGPDVELHQRDHQALLVGKDLSSSICHCDRGPPHAGQAWACSSLKGPSGQT